jgi:hypothetical protein
MTEAKNLYDQKLGSAGWSVTSSMALQDNTAISAEKNNRSVVVGIAKSDNKVIVTITTYTNTTNDTNTSTPDDVDQE